MPSIIQHTNGNLYSLVEDDQGWCSTEVQRTMHARMCVHTHTLNPTTLGAMTAGKIIVERGVVGGEVATSSSRRKAVVHGKFVQSCLGLLFGNCQESEAVAVCSSGGQGRGPGGRANGERTSAFHCRLFRTILFQNGLYITLKITLKIILT